MAEPVRIRPLQGARTPAREAPEESPCSLLRYVDGPDGRPELRDTPLTPEDFLNPQIGDTLVQGRPHDKVARHLTDLLERGLASRPDILVLHELKHLLGPGLPGPGPDISVIVGLSDPDPDMTSYDVAATGIPPSLIIEVISPSDRRIREVDELVKPKLYARIGVEEYLMVDLPRRANNRRFRLRGQRLDDQGRYQAMEPDAQGRFFSQVTGLLFGVSAQGDRIEVFVAATGERLLSAKEEEEGRKAAEAELAHLREELKRLRGE
jgi:Uma2 family endonuclease